MEERSSKLKLNFGQDKVVVVEMNSTLTSEVSPAFIIGIVKIMLHVRYVRSQQKIEFVHVFFPR